MSVVRAHEPIARSEITEFTSLSQQSVHRVVESLTEQKLLNSTKAVIKGRGKPSPQVSLDNSSTYSLGISIRTDKVELMAMSLSGIELQRTTLEIDPNDRVGTLNALGRKITDWSCSPEFESRTAIGVGVAVQGYRTTKMSQFTTPLPIHNWSKISIDDTFSSALELVAFAENNATCAAIAEHHCARNESYRNLAYLSFNFGFGGGIVSNGTAVIGGFGNAGELGNLFFEAEMKNRPALEELLGRLNDSGVKLDDIPDLQNKFDPAWPAVTEWLKEIRFSLNLTIRAIGAVVDPEAIFFGGEAPAKLRELLIGICEHPSKNRYGEVMPFPKLLPSRIDGDAAVYGAAILPARQLIY